MLQWTLAQAATAEILFHPGSDNWASRGVCNARERCDSTFAVREGVLQCVIERPDYVTHPNWIVEADCRASSVCLRAVMSNVVPM